MCEVYNIQLFAFEIVRDDACHPILRKATHLGTDNTEETQNQRLSHRNSQDTVCKRKCWLWGLLPVSWIKSRYERLQSEVIQETLQTSLQEVFLLSESQQLELLAVTHQKAPSVNSFKKRLDDYYQDTCSKADASVVNHLQVQVRRMFITTKTGQVKREPLFVLLCMNFAGTTQWTIKNVTFYFWL